MKPVGLSYKSDGELMVVHLCLGCGKISGNRIAGDDNPYAITCLLEKPCNLNEGIISRLTGQGFRLLSQGDTNDVLTILYGCGYLRHENADT